jgi:Kef-type K+ transport system membrane component KefB
VISILLLQDIIAIFTLLLIHGASTSTGLNFAALGGAVLALPTIFIIAFLVERYVLIKIIQKFSRIHEYLFLVAIGWCLGLGELAQCMNLSFEIGAFIAGISIAQSPISRFIADSLRPIRDFFLILFFFSLGAKINLAQLSQVWMWAVLLGGIMLVIKPVVLQPLLRNITASKAVAWEVGIRLGQISEFSLLVAYTAEKSALISQDAYSFIQITTIVTFLVSSYWVVNRYPTPIAFNERLRRD